MAGGERITEVELAEFDVANGYHKKWCEALERNRRLTEPLREIAYPNENTRTYEDMFRRAREALQREALGEGVYG